MYRITDTWCHEHHREYIIFYVERASHKTILMGRFALLQLNQIFRGAQEVLRVIQYMNLSKSAKELEILAPDWTKGAPSTGCLWLEINMKTRNSLDNFPLDSSSELCRNPKIRFIAPWMDVLGNGAYYFWREEKKKSGWAAFYCINYTSCS